MKTRFPSDWINDPKMWKRLPDGCLEWRGSTEEDLQGKTRGIFYISGKKYYVRLEVYKKHHRHQKAAGLLVVPRCGNSLCGEPTHLRIGLPDKPEFNDRIVRERLDNGESPTDLSREYGVRLSRIIKVAAGAYGDRPRDTNLRKRVGQALDRRLKSTEEVHHRDTNYSNDSFDNLVIATPREHGQMHSMSPPSIPDNQKTVADLIAEKGENSKTNKPR